MRGAQDDRGKENTLTIHFNRGLVTLWKGDPATPGALYSLIVLTSPDLNSTAAIFQVLAREGAGEGIVEGKVVIPQNQGRTIFDGDFIGEAAKEQFDKLVSAAEASGFVKVTRGDRD